MTEQLGKVRIVRVDVQGDLDRSSSQAGERDELAKLFRLGAKYPALELEVSVAAPVGHRGEAVAARRPFLGPPIQHHGVPYRSPANAQGRHGTARRSYVSPDRAL